MIWIRISLIWFRPGLIFVVLGMWGVFYLGQILGAARHLKGGQNTFLGHFQTFFFFSQHLFSSFLTKKKIYTFPKPQPNAPNYNFYPLSLNPAMHYRSTLMNGPDCPSCQSQIPSYLNLPHLTQLILLLLFELNITLSLPRIEMCWKWILTVF